jgi:hypothetical protein
LTERGAASGELGPLHPASRLGRVLQQLRSFSALHAGELESLIAQLEAAGQTELATRLGVYRDLHAQEAELIVDELADLHAELERAARAAAPPEAPDAADPAAGAAPGDPAAGSPRRARWLAEQARRAERPVSRRGFLGGGKDRT